MRLVLDGVAMELDGRTIVSGADLVAESGQFVGLVGPNGCGKSTLLRVIYRVLRPKAGLISLDGVDLAELTARESARRSAVVAPEHPAEFDFTVDEVVAMGRTPHKRALDRNTVVDQQICTAALERVGMAATATRTFTMLSGGERQRVGLGPVADLLADLLGGAVRVERGTVERDVFPGPDVVVSCAGWLPDTHWRTVDRWTTEHAGRLASGVCREPSLRRRSFLPARPDRRLRRHPSPPTGRDRTVQRPSRFAPWSADRETSGAAFGDPDAARHAAIGEAVERYCGNAVPDRLTITSFAKLRAAGRRAIDPAELSRYSEEQYATRGFPFVSLSRDLEVAWVAGRDLVDGAETLVPAALVYLNYLSGRGGAEPATTVQAFAGIAAGRTAAAATRSALEELPERDAVTLWWTSGAPATRVEPAADSVLSHLLADPDAAGLQISFLQIPSSFPVSVLGA